MLVRFEARVRDGTVVGGNPGILFDRVKLKSEHSGNFVVFWYILCLVCICEHLHPRGMFSLPRFLHSILNNFSMTLEIRIKNLLFI